MLHNKRILLPAFAFFVLMVYTGCAPRAMAPRHDNPFPITSGEYSRYFESAIGILRNEGFPIDREDYRFGTVTTQPMDSPTMFALGSSLNMTGNQTVGSTVNAERRQILVQIDRVAPPAKKSGGGLIALPLLHDYVLHVEVIVERHVKPTAYITGSAFGHRVISHLSGLPTEWKRRGIAADYWRPVKRDVELEQRLLHRIIEQARNS